MKYYTYISDSKVDMLLPQVPDAVTKKIAREFQLDLKVFKATYKSESNSNADRIHRLLAVTEYIQETARVGTVDEPDEYVSGTMPVQFIPLVHNTITYWGTTEETTLLLGGSLKHMIGAIVDPMSTNQPLSSILSWLMDAVRQELVTDKNLDFDPYTLQSVEDAAHYCMRTPGYTQQVEFIAKRLVSGVAEHRQSNAPRRVLVATPIYIALAE